MSSSVATRMQTGVAFNLVGSVFNQGSTLVVNLAVANLLGRDVFGQYTMVLATIATLASIGQLSMGYTATKHVAEFRSTDCVKASRILGVCAMVSAVAALFAAAGLALAAGTIAGRVLGSPDLAPQLRLASGAVFFSIINGFITGALAGLEGYRALAKAGMASGTIYGLLCTGGAWASGLTGAVIGLAVSAFAQFVILARSLVLEGHRQGISVRCRDLSQERAILFGFAVPASLSAWLFQPALWIATALLARQTNGYNELALFGAANAFRSLVLFVPQAVNNVGMSVLNNQRQSSPDGYRSVFYLNAIMTTVTAIGVAGALFLAGAPLLRLFGPAFTEGRLVLGIMLAAGIVEALSVAAYQIVVSHGRIWASLAFVSVPRDLSLVLLAAVLTPTLGAAGLATAYAIGWFLALVGVLGIVSRLGLETSVPGRVVASAP
jgi:O-antigen/teichoic acid export membrane protein